MSIRSQAKKASFLLFALFLIPSCARLGPERWHAYTLLFFDTICDVKLRCPGRQLAAAEKEVERVFASIEEHFAPGRQNPSSPLVLELYQKALPIFRDSEGCFDITVGPLLDLWGFRSGAYRVPSAEEIQAVLPSVGMEKILVGTEGLSLAPGMSLDWGGIAKGWAVDLASIALQKMGIRDGFINAGGDLYCWGQNQENGEWRIGIKNPRGPGYLGVILATETAVATSGDYQRFFDREGRRYHHIFDPRTGFPAQGKRSVTVVGPEAVICDALSTALFVSPSPESILQKYPPYGAIVVDDSGCLALMGKPVRLELVKQEY